MRIRLYLGADLDNNKLPDKTIELLRDELTKDANVSITAENPDVVHFIGAWTPDAIKIAKDAKIKHIATVHTPLGAIAPWQKPRSAHFRLTMECTCIVASGKMEMEIIDNGNIKTLHNITNPIVTRETSSERMADEYKAVYMQAIKSNDDELWEDIARKVQMIREPDEVILNICKHILYAQCLANRHNIPQTFLNRLSSLLINSNYDEDRLGEVLTHIHLYPFAQRLEYILQERTPLTEGFMPLPMKDDKTARQMLSLITEYNK